jgi:hypothetical protein
MVTGSRRGVALGVIIALGIPALNFGVALLWQLGLLPLGDHDGATPNNALVQALFATVGWELVLGPVGILIAGWSAARRGIGAWISLIIVAGPAVLILWLFAGLYLSFVNGSLF